MAKERRESTRVAAAHGVKITVLSVPGAPELENKTFDGRSNDLSSRGMRFCLDTALPKHCPIELRIIDETTHKGFWHVGHVVWIRKGGNGDGYQVGVRFTETPEETLAEWEELLAEKLARATA